MGSDPEAGSGWWELLVWVLADSVQALKGQSDGLRLWVPPSLRPWPRCLEELGTQGPGMRKPGSLHLEGRWQCVDRGGLQFCGPQHSSLRWPSFQCLVGMVVSTA